jgi:type IV pilus assembly protein PilB
MSENTPASIPANSTGGDIPSILLNEGIITQEQLSYARRVQQKLSSNRTLIDTIKELGYATGEQVSEALGRNHTSIRIGSLLVELGYLSETDLNSALNIQKESTERKKLGEVLIEHGFIDEHQFFEVLSSQLSIPLVDLEFRKIDQKFFKQASFQLCREFMFIPLEMEGKSVSVVFADPLDKSGRARAEQIFGQDLVPMMSPKKCILNAIALAERNAGRAEAGAADEGTIIGIINRLFEDALTDNASDIHIEPMKDRIRVRFRRDGVMMQHRDLPLDLAPQLSSRIKVMAQADIAERRRHQDGRILFESERHGYTLDIRVSIYVTIFGEKIVMRLLNKKGIVFEVNHIGMAPRMLEQFIYNALDTPTGVMIITGPTGSGKTSTLYSCLGYLNNINTSIITAEDPVEYVIEGISQCSINQKIGVTFEETLRHIVRQDPDIIVLGEIRDTFSAETAIQAALTGHKVLTTFHTEDSIGGLIRLMNMEIEAFLISSTVVCVVAQRLLRLVCKSCSRPYIPTPLEYSRLGYSAKELGGATFMKGDGCKECRFTGFKGRMAIFELLVLNEKVKDAILCNKSSAEIRRISMETTGLVTLFEDGLVKAAQGLVSIEEVLRHLPRISRPRPLHELRRILGS